MSSGTVSPHSFSNCLALESVTWTSASKAVIANYAFNGCINLAQVVLPANCEVAPYAFHGCTKLEAKTKAKQCTVFELLSCNLADDRIAAEAML